MSVPPHQDRATGGLYRSAHAVGDGGRRAPDDATLISVDDPVPGAAAAPELFEELFTPLR